MSRALAVKLSMKAMHTSKPNEITSLTNNMNKNIFSMYKKSNSALGIESNIAHIKNRDRRIYSHDSISKTMTSVGTESNAKRCKKTLKIDIKELLQAEIAVILSYPAPSLSVFLCPNEYVEI